MRFAVVVALALAVGFALASGREGVSPDETIAARPVEDKGGTAADIVVAARGQIGITRTYDPAYVQLDFPGGDVSRDRGVCTDVIIRALRDGTGLDLQRAVNRDMSADFATYPKIWGLSRPDRNIDHRRVPNLATLLTRAGARLTEGEPFLPGDIVSAVLPPNLPHVMIVSDRRALTGQPLVIHNVGAGTREEDALTAWPVTGHFRLSEEVMRRLRALDQ